MEVAYQPEKLFARYQYQCDYTYAQRIKVPVTPEQKSWANIKRGLIMLRNIFWKVGVLGDYERCSGSSRWDGCVAAISRA